MLLFFENIKIAIFSLRANKMRSFLTILGIIIGVFSVVMLLGIGEGVKKEVSKQIQNLGSNLITIVPGKIEEGRTSFNPASSVGLNTLKMKDIKAIKKIPEIEKASPLTLIGGVVKIEKGKQSPQTISLGVNEEFFEITNGKLAEGRFFNKDENKKKRKVAVVGYTTKNKLFGNKKVLGKKIKVYNQDFEVIGVLEKDENAGFGSMDFNDVVFVPFNTISEITKNNQIFRIFIKVKEASKIEEVKEKIKKTMLLQHKNEEDFSVLTQKDLLSTFSSIINLLTAMLSAIGAISLLVGGVGIMNIMLVSVTERTKEIGIRKAIGATNGNILLQFLIEAATLSFFGGMVGLGLSWIITLLIKKFSLLSPEINLFIVLLAFGVSFGIGIIFGLAPAIKAAKKDPIEALRYE